MRKQRAMDVDVTSIPLPRRSQSKLIQSTGRNNKNGSALLFHQKLLPPAPPRSTSVNGGVLRPSQYCLSSSSMGVRKTPSRVFFLSKGRFGKRPPSFIPEYAAPAIDSEDSGFGCDFHSSESQLSWSNDEATKLGATTNITSAILQPIFSLTSKTPSSNSLSSTSSHISTSSTSSSPASSFTIPQFSSSSPSEKQFLTTLLHESLAQEDHAIDQFDGPYSSTTTAISPTTATSTISHHGSPFASISSPTIITPNPESTVQSAKVLLIVPGSTTSEVIPNQPLDFAQVFGKLSSTTLNSAAIFNSGGIVNELLQAKTSLSPTASGEEQTRERVVQQQLACDSRVIKTDQETHNKNSKLSPQILTHSEANNNDANITNGFDLTSYTLKCEQLTDDITSISHSSKDSTPTSIPSSATLTGSYNIGGSRDILDLHLERSIDQAVHSGLCDVELASTVRTTAVPEVPAVDPMVILSQAVNLQKELFEEPALDGIPVSVKHTSRDGFGFSKDITTTTTTATPVPTLKGLVTDAQLTPSQPLATILPQQTRNQSVLDTAQQPMKLMQLTENVRMSPDTTRRATAAHQVTTAPMLTTATTSPLIINSTTPRTAAVTGPSPIPMKRSRFTFPHPAASKGTGLKLRNQNHNQNYMPTRSVGKRLPPGTTPTLTSNLASFTRDGRAQLQMVSQPEEQHRARYQTEGSRGAIKDRKGNGFPTVKLVGYDKPATLQIFIGTDQGKVSPHMFYQACKVTGKSSTPCIEKKVEGTILIEIEFEPTKEMVISCDCVGILKERNVDVEQRFPFHHASQSRKKSTKCRMIFRTTVLNGDGIEETLQVASLPILCTQPPGVPEICKQSLTECPAKGGLELFVIGKNFLKDTRVIFQQEDVEGRVLWEASSEPLKDYLQQNHLICAVPPFKEEKILEPVECKMLVVSGGKHSEPHRLTYLPELATAHQGILTSLSSCLPNTQPPQQSQIQAPSVIQAALVQQISGGPGLLPVDLQTVNVNTIIPPVENGLVKSVIMSSPSDACSPMSISSPEGSLCSTVSQPSPQATATNPVTPVTLNQLSTLGFSPVSLIQSPVSNADNTVVVGNFQSVLQQAVHQQQQSPQVESKPVVELMKTATELMESINKPPVTSAFTSLSLQAEKPAVSNAIPLDLQFPTQDLPTTETTTITTIANPFQSNNPLNCVNLPQLMNGMGLAGTIPTTATSPPVISTAAVAVADAQQQRASTADEVVIAAVTAPATVAVTPLTVADCLGQAIIKAEPTTAMTNDLRLTMSNSIVTVAPTTAAPLSNGGAPPVMGLLGGGDLQPHQGTLANALSQMSDNELINYINPNCFDGPLL